MNTITARTAFAATAFALVGALSAVSAQAQDLTRAQVRDSVIAAQKAGTLPSVGDQWGFGAQSTGASNVSRAEVSANARRALANGEIEAQLGDSYAYGAQPATGSSLSRAEVRADTARAIQRGEVNALVGNSYGYGAYGKSL